MATFSKSYSTGSDLFPIASTAASTTATGSAFDVSTKMDGTIMVRFGRRSATAAGAGVNIRIESASRSSGNNCWFPIFIFTTAFAACEAEAVSGTVNAGTNVVTVASTTNLAVGDIVYIDNSTIANSEWGRVKSIVTNTSITLEDNLVNAQTGSTIYDTAEIYSIVSLPAGTSRIRVVADGASFTQAFALEVAHITVDGIA